MSKWDKVNKWLNLVLGVGYLSLFATDVVLNKKKGS